MSSNGKKLNTKLEKIISTKSNTTQPVSAAGVIVINPNPPTLNDRQKIKTIDKQLRDREEGFSVYIMGANEERVKNMRKKEQIEKSKNRSNNNSKSTVTRKKWDAHQPQHQPHNQAQHQALNYNENNIHRLVDSNSVEKNDKYNRSKSRHNTAGVDYNAVSKLIIGDSNTTTNNKHISSKDSLNNIEEMLYNINSMKKNVNSNLNRIGIESPLNNNSPIIRSHLNMNMNMNMNMNTNMIPINNTSKTSNTKDFRRRNWGEPKYGLGIVYPEFSSSVEHSNEPNRINKLRIETNESTLITTKSKNTKVYRKQNSNFEHKNHNIEELSNYEEELESLLGRGVLKINHLESLNSIPKEDNNNMTHSHTHSRTNTLANTNPHTNSVVNLNINASSSNNVNSNNKRSIRLKDYSNMVSMNLLKNSNSSLTLSRMDLLNNNNREKSNHIGNNNNNNNIQNNNKSNLQFNFWGDNLITMTNMNHSLGISHKNINNSLEMVNKKDMLVLDNMNNSDLMNSSNKLENFSLNKQVKECEGMTVNMNINPNIKKIKSPNNRIQSVNKTKIVANDRPFSSVLNLSKLKSINNETVKGKSSTFNNNNYNNNNNNNIYKNTNNLMPSIQFIYKSPQNKNKNKRPLSHLQKAKLTNTNTKKDTIGVPSINNIQHIHNLTMHNANYQNSIAERFSSREQITSKLGRTDEKLDSSITKANKTIFNTTTNKKKKSSSIYPVISNIQQINKFPNLSNIVSNSNSKSKSKNNSKNNSNSNSYSNSNKSVIKNGSKKRYDLLSKIEQMDEKKLSKLARVVEELANISDEQSDFSLLENLISDNNQIGKNGENSENGNINQIRNSSKNLQNMIFNNITDKFNINYINADSVNFGNININYSGARITNLEHSAKSSFNNSSLREKDSRDKRQNFEDEFNNFLNEDENYSSGKRREGGENSNSKLYTSSATVNPFKRNTLIKSPSTSPISNHSVISIEILSTWGNLEKVGLTEIQILDAKNTNVDIIDCHVYNGSEEGIGKITNGVYHSFDEGNMWVSNYNNETHTTTSNILLNNIKIEIYFESIYEVEKMIIWNFNGRDLNKGVKEIEVYKRNNFVWKGIINKGSSNFKSDYSTKLIFNNNSKNENIKYNFELSNVFSDSLLLQNDKILSPHRNSQTKMNDNKLLREDLELLSQQEEDYLHLHLQSSINSVKSNSINSVNSVNKIKSKSNYSQSNKIIVNRRDSNKLNNSVHAINIISNLNSARNFNITGNSNLKDDLVYENILRTSFGLNTSNNFNNLLDKMQIVPVQAASIIKDNNTTFAAASAYANANANVNYVTCSRLKMIISSNYGDSNYVGLTGMQMLDNKGELINIERAKTIGAMPKDINTIYNDCGDRRIFENIFNNLNETSDDVNMWLTQYNAFSPPYIEFSFEKAITISEFKFWNYNRPGQLERGARTIELILDENYIAQKTLVLRKGVAEEGVDYSQSVKLPVVQFTLTDEQLEPFRCVRPASLSFSQDYETPYLPTGFIFKVTLMSTWGDQHFIGLNGIEFFDPLGLPIFTYNTPRLLFNPYKKDENYNDKSISNNSENDICSLINGIKSSNERDCCWLTPFSNVNRVEEKDNLENTFSNLNKNKNNNNNNNCNWNKPNTIYLIFDKPVSVSYIQFWNYSKNIERGVNELHIACDDSIIYKGCLRKSENNKSTVVLFTSDKMITKNIDQTMLTNSMVTNSYKITDNQNKTDLSKLSKVLKDLLLLKSRYDSYIIKFYF